jgi:hypothetical protein
VATFIVMREKPVRVAKMSLRIGESLERIVLTAYSI